MTEPAPQAKPEQPSSKTSPIWRAVRSFGRFLTKIWNGTVEIATSEWILTRVKLANGGGIITFRALLSATYLYFGVLGLRNLLDPDRTWDFSLHELRLQMLATPHWFGAILAAAYTALYTRYSSQWTYLANLYNQIKASQASSSESATLQEWKAGFIEDAEELHLSTKPLFASIIHAWGAEPCVKAEFSRNSPGGEGRFKKIMERVNHVWEEHAKETTPTE